MKEVWVASVFSDASDLRSLNSFFFKSKALVDYKVSPIYGFNKKNVIAFCAKTEASFKDLINMMKQFEESRVTTAEIFLLNYEGVEQRSEEASSPYPRWTIKPELLFPSAMIDSTWVHPIFKQSLSELTAEFGEWEGGSYKGEFRGYLDIS